MSLNILLKRSSTPNKRPTAASLQYGELVLNYDEATGGLFYKDDLDNILKVGPCQVGTTAPNATPAGSAGNGLGEFWFDTASDSLKIWDGTAWVATAGSGSVVSVTGTSPIVVDNTDAANPVISVTAATTVGNEGVVQLSNDLNDTSTTGWAATPFAVSLVNDDVQTRLSKADGGTMQGNINMSAGTEIQFSTNSSVLTGVTSSTSTTSATLAASATAVKSAYDLANAALPKAGGTMTGAITAAAAGVIFSDASSITALSDSTSTTSSVIGASSTAVKAAYDLANGALPLTGGTVTGDIVLSGAGVGIVFNDASTVEAISDSTSTVSSVIAASSTAVKSAYDLAAGALSAGGGTMTGVIVFDAAQTFSVTGIQNATLVQKGVVQVGTNIDVAAGVISVADGTTSAKGVVQLYNNTDSTSTALALTAAQGKNLQDQIDALVLSSNLTLAGTLNASTGLVDNVTTAGTAAGFVAGSALPAAAAGNADYFVIVDVEGSTGPSGTPPYHIGDWFLSNGTAWQFLNVGFQAAAATTTVEGVVYLATDAEVQAGTDTSNKAVNPASLQSKVSDSTSTTDSYSIASSTAVKSAYDLANAALPKAGGTMTGGINLAAAGVTFSNASQVTAISDSTSTTSSVTAASSTAVKSAYDLAAAAVPLPAGIVKGSVLVGTGAGTIGALPIGTAGQFAVVDATTASGLAYTSTVDGGTF
jgi:hypothetical protein